MLIFYISLSVFVSFICSMLEAVILSLTPSYLSSLKDQKPRLYQKVHELKKDIEKPLASILTFNTIAHTIGAAGAGAEAQRLWGNEYLALFSAVLTFIILFFSEIIPKSIGAKNWKNLLGFTCLVLKPMIIISLPIVWFSAKLSKLIKGKEESPISRDEIPALAEIGFQSGVIDQGEYQSLKSLINFADVKLGDIVTPASGVVGIQSDLKVSEALDEVKRHTFSRLLVFGINRDDIKGYVLKREILQSYIDEQDFKISEISKKILILSDTTTGQELFERLLERRSHIAAVINEEGRFIGIVTLEDLIEKLLGHNIQDENDLY
ncbi:MAG: CNNM domain-containing protein [Bacteriovoracaceae bacterium]